MTSRTTDTSDLERSLDPLALINTACQQTGLDDYGADERFLEAMTRWLSSVASEGRLNAVGVAAVQGNVMRVLMTRLRFYDDLKKHPEILEEDVSDPVMITGLPRTGTTKLQRIMSCDPTVRFIPLWLLMFPAPEPGWKRGDPDPRLDMAKAATEQQIRQYPDIQLGHPVAAELAEEEAYLLDLTFESPLAITRRAPSFVSWWLEQPQEPPYEFLRSMLQYLQWQAGGRRGRHFLLKAVTSHFGNLDVAAKVFPQATIVVTHRDLKSVVPSGTRLLERVRRTVSDDVDPLDCGTFMFDFLKQSVDRHLAQRDALGDTARIVDMAYKQVDADPVDAARTISRRHGTPLTPEAEHALATWEQRDPHGGSHSYSLERHGFTEAQIDEAFSGYVERFQPYL